MGIFSKKQSNLPGRRMRGDSDSNVASFLTISDSFKKNANLNNFSGRQVIDDSPRVQHHHLITKRRKLFGVLLGTIVIIIGLALLIDQFTASVQIKVSNKNIGTTVDISIYEQSIQKYLDSNPLGRLRFALDGEKLNDYIITSHSEVKSVVQNSAVGLGVSQFAILFREPVASWNIGSDKYYVDSDGVAFSTNLFSEPSVKVVDKSGYYLESGSASVSQRFLGFVGRIVALSSNAGYQITEAILPENTTRQLNIQLLSPSILVKMTIDRSAADQVGDMDRAVKYIQNKSSLPAYIDVRVDDKVFYK